jgi:anaphase-promoting complex subunit 8
MAASSSRGGSNIGVRSHHRYQHQRRQQRHDDIIDDEVDNIDHDSSTAMSLDDSSTLNASSAATPLSVDMSGGGASFARARGSDAGDIIGNKGRNSFGFGGTTSSPLFSPLASQSTSMSISGINTPMGFSTSRRVDGATPSGISTDGKNEKGDHNDVNVESLKLVGVNGNGENSTAMAKNPLNLNVQADGGADDVVMRGNQQLTAATIDQTPHWNRSWSVHHAKIQLRRASRECSRRGLKLASRWASEQLMGLATTPQPSHNNRFMLVEEGQFLAEEGCRPNDTELYAMSLFDLGEYSRAAHALSAPTISVHNAARARSSDESHMQINPPRTDLTALGIYLRAFSLYLEGERRKEEQVTELRDPLERSSLRNVNLPRLEVELRLADSLGKLDAFGLYVYGVVLKSLRGAKHAPLPIGTRTTKKSGNGKEEIGDTAHQILIRSILLYPFNWSAWLDLGELCVDDSSIDEEVEKLLLPIADHWMYHFFCVHVFIDNKANENAISIIEKLANGSTESKNGENDPSFSASSSGFFVQSAYLQSQLAMAYYDVRDYDSAHEHFLALSRREPYRLDHMDAFSNVLYVKDQKVSLSHLAHRSVTVDKYRPETCIIVGNYYSSRGRHEKAVQYFQRALKLDRTYLSAWTLLGHEYIEMKNTAAAIEAYRRAVDISDREYRAWYGLGQTYEIMNMLLHALFYFRKAAALHPHDARMWCAIGGCLLGLDRRMDAEKSYERAVSLGDGEGIATRKLAELYREDGDEEKAAKCFLRHLELRYHLQLPGSFSGARADTSPEAFETIISNIRVDEPEAEALLFLAYYYRDNMEYDQAILCATRLEDYPGPEKEQGKSLLRDIRSRMDQKAGERSQGRIASSSSHATPAMGFRSRRNLSSGSENSSVNEDHSFEFSP